MNKFAETGTVCTDNCLSTKAYTGLNIIILRTISSQEGTETSQRMNAVLSCKHQVLATLPKYFAKILNICETPEIIIFFKLNSGGMADMLTAEYVRSNLTPHALEHEILATWQLSLHSVCAINLSTRVPSLPEAKTSPSLLKQRVCTSP